MEEIVYLDKVKEYRKLYYLTHKKEIKAKAKKRHKKNYVPKKRKTTIDKEVDGFSELLNKYKIIINF